LHELHDYRRGQYEKLADEVYEEKGYDSQGSQPMKLSSGSGSTARSFTIS